MGTTGFRGERRGIDAEPTDRSDEVDAACSLLADAGRRALLATMIEREGEAFRFPELVEAVARRTGDDRRTVAIELHHGHLPKVARAGIVEYDRRSRDVRYHSHDVVEAALGS